MTAGRIGEVLRLKKPQFDFESEFGFIVVRNFYVSKRKEKTIKARGKLYIDLPLTMDEKSKLFPFTEMIYSYLRRVEDESLFKFGRKRAWQIVNYVTDLFPHAFRSYAETYWINILKSETITAKIFGIENPGTISHYFKGTWLDYKEAFR